MPGRRALSAPRPTQRLTQEIQAQPQAVVSGSADLPSALGGGEEGGIVTELPVQVPRHTGGCWRETRLDQLIRPLATHLQ